MGGVGFRILSSIPKVGQLTKNLGLTTKFSNLLTFDFF